MKKKLRNGRVLRYSPSKQELVDGLDINVEQATGGYMVARVKLGHNHRPRLHRVLMDCYDPDVLVDHKDGDSLNCTDENLRLADHTQNNWNSRKKSSPSTSKYKGVSYDKVAGKWKARIFSYGKQICLGYRHSEEEAALLYNEAALRIAGEFARINEIPEVGQVANGSNR